jgi:Holliday junction DNA helicase RuvB
VTTTTQADAARRSARSAVAKMSPPKPKVGDAIFEGTSYPRTWDGYIGQTKAIVQIRAACYSARARQSNMDHVLIATGHHGIGKTALAKLIAADLGTGLIEIQGSISEDEARLMFAGMEDNDVLFWDEIHLAATRKSSWLLSVLQDGVLITKRGVETLPKITVIAATTDAQKLPETILSRFKVRPLMEAYTDAEAARIAFGMATRLFDHPGLRIPSLETCVAVAVASNTNPRECDVLLTVLRDAALTGHATADTDGTYDLAMALEWQGTTADGLTRLAQDYLCTLLSVFEGQAGEKTIANALGEPTAPRHTEKLLVSKGLLTITPTGRQITELGVERTVTLLTERGLLEEDK